MHHLIVTTLLWLPMAEKSAPAPTAEVKELVGQPVKLEVLPRKLTFGDARDVQQLLVTGIEADGDVRDLTRLVKYRADGPQVTVNPTGEVRPGKTGAGTITVTIAGHAIKIPIEVAADLQASPVNFFREVVPAFTRSGCNSGACHGTPSGKNGFRLSLQGYLPDQDLEVLTREVFARRTNPIDPESSLILQKGLGVVSHQGGKRLATTEATYQAVHGWIAAGCPTPPVNAAPLSKLEILPAVRTLKNDAKRQQVVVIAHFTDGSKQDVTSLTMFSSSDDLTATVTKQGLVDFKRRGSVAILCRYLYIVDNAKLSYLEDQPGFVWKNPPEQNFIDKHVHDRLKLLQIEPSELCSDEEFVRRVHLDLAGVLPKPERVKQFLADASTDKRNTLIDEVLELPTYADFWALKWADVLRNNRKQVAYRGAHGYRRYLVRQFANNRPFNEFVKELLTAAGDTMMNPAANYFRIAKDPQDCAETTAQLFLGVRMQCAKCHNHPFERWTQDDYYSFAAYFAQVSRKKPVATGETEVIFLNRDAEVKHLRTGAVMKPKAPGTDLQESPADEDRRLQFVDWLTSPGNAFFAKSVVNRIWYHVVGKGIVDPVDDFRDSNPPSNEALLEALSQQFVKDGYDVKKLIRLIAQSRTYQLSAKPNKFNADDEKFFSRTYPKLLSAEQLLDAISDVTQTPEAFKDLPVGTRAIQLPDTEFDHSFLQAFGQPSRELACECARESDSTLNQALNLINGDVIHSKLRLPENRIGKLIEQKLTDEEIIAQMYLVSLSRPASDAEIAIGKQHLAKAADRRKALEDILWALINSKEFLFRH